MSKERPTDDPREQNDWPSMSQRKKPWEEKPEKDQRANVTKEELDLEKWQRTKTH
jgi:hypothetical protein